MLRVYMCAFKLANHCLAIRCDSRSLAQSLGFEGHGTPGMNAFGALWRAGAVVGHNPKIRDFIAHPPSAIFSLFDISHTLLYIVSSTLKDRP